MKIKGASSRPRGVTLLATIVCLVVVTSITGIMIRQAMVQHRNLRIEQTKMQALWIVESACRRARAQLSDADYQGEAWGIPAPEIDDIHAGQVTIKVSRLDLGQAVVVVDIEVDLTQGKIIRVHDSRQFRVPLAAQEETP